MTTEKHVTCPECSDPGPHITWTDDVGEWVTECTNCQLLFQPIDL